MLVVRMSPHTAFREDPVIVLPLNHRSRTHSRTSALRRLMSVGALTVACLITTPLPAQAVEPGTVAVSGHGTASAVPDIAVINLGVEVKKPTATEATAAQASTAQALLDAVRAQGVSDRDIRTERVWLNPVYENNQANDSQLAGFQAGQSFSVKVRDVKKTAAILRAAVDAAGDAGRINGVAFDVEDRTMLRSRARATAFKDAHAKAAQYAELSGHPLGRLVSVDEAGGAGGSPVPIPTSAVADGAQVPVAPGEIKDEVVVRVVYQLD